jgi:hypothetical protein
VSRTPAAHLAGLKVRYPDWRFYRIAAERISPPASEDGYLAQRRDRPEVEFFATSVDRLEAMVTSWKPPKPEAGQ